MIKTCLAICICLFAVADLFGQSRSKTRKQAGPLKQPREVVEAYQACRNFQHMLAENLNFNRAFEATFVRDPARRRAIAIAEGEHGIGDLSQVDDETVVGIYKDQAQGIVLMLPLMFGGGEDAQAELFPPQMKAIFERKPPTDPQKLKAYAAQLNRDIADFRAHVDKLAVTNPSVAKNLREYKDHLLKPLEPPNRIVKPLTAYSKGTVLRQDERYYQIDDCAVIREGGKMRLIGYTFIKLRF